MAKAAIKAEALIMPNKTAYNLYVSENQTINVDIDMANAREHLIEWLVLGEADYCMSPSMDFSTFSHTALAR